MFDSHRIIASGRGEFYPVKSNDTPDGRAGNRRTEIILSPDLNELFKLLDQ
jgi:chemotaxis protein MotB